MGMVPPRILRSRTEPGQNPTRDVAYGDGIVREVNDPFALEKRLHKNPPQSVSGVIPYAERVMLPQFYDPNKSTYVSPSARNSATLTLMKMIECEIAQRSQRDSASGSEQVEYTSDGIMPSCRYEDL